MGNPFKIELTGRRIAAFLARYSSPTVLVLACLVLWQLGTMLSDIQDWLLPSPVDVLRAAWGIRGIISPHIWQTAQETLWGFILALVVGLGLGLLIDVSPWMRDALYPLLVISQTIPIIAIAPLLVIWLGYGIWPKIIVVGLICFFPIVVNTADGLRGIDRELVDLLRTMGANKRAIFIKVRLPGALPAIFSGIKVAITYSVVGAIMGEWVGGSRGLGIFMLRSTNSFRTDRVFVSVGITALLSIFLFGLVVAIERAALRWRYAAVEERWEEIPVLSAPEGGK
ncbi:MAG: ABC transporter permease [Chloroflexi bacterium]|nr:ABC transporter permease [Chloroflexota bacterium]